MVYVHQQETGSKYKFLLHKFFLQIDLDYEIHLWEEKRKITPGLRVKEESGKS